MSAKYDVAVVGATGAVGETMLEILAERKFPVNQVYPLASERSAGKKVPFGNTYLTVENLDNFDFSRVQIGLFSAGAGISKKFAPIAAAAGCVVIDNSSLYRYDPEIPLIVPEVNPDEIEKYTNRNIIANPNCTTIITLMDPRADRWVARIVGHATRALNRFLGADMRFQALPCPFDLYTDGRIGDGAERGRAGQVQSKDSGRSRENRLGRSGL